MTTARLLKLRALRLAMFLLLVPSGKQAWAGSNAAASNAVFVFAHDSLSGRPVVGVQVYLQRPGWYVSETHREPSWFAFTDSAGGAHLESIPAGTYNVQLCHESFERKKVRVELAGGGADTLGVNLLYDGGPHDGRRCEAVFLDRNDSKKTLELWRHGLKATDTVFTTRASSATAMAGGAPEPSHHGERTRGLEERLNIIVDGDMDDIVLTDPLGRSNRDSSGYVIGDIPECIRDDLREEGQLSQAIGFLLANPLHGTYRLIGRTRKRAFLRVQALHFCVDGDVRADSWEGAVVGRSAWGISADRTKTDSCSVLVRPLPVKTGSPAGR